MERGKSFVKVAVFHPGTQHSWQTATALQELDRLEFFATSIFYKPEEWPYRIERYLPARLRRKVHSEFNRFSFDGLDPQKVKAVGIFEWLERISARAGWANLAVKLDNAGNSRFHKLLEQEIRSDRDFALWGYNSSSLESFELAKAHGRILVLDRTIGDWRHYNRIMSELFETHGEWFTALDAAAPPARIERDELEYAAADIIVCGSDHCAATLTEYAAPEAVSGKLKVLPYCFDADLFSSALPPLRVDRNGPVKFLFVGQIGMRKGVHHVLEAISKIPRADAELTLVGQMNIPHEIFSRYRDRVTYLPTVPRSAIPRLMARHHAMVFPSYFEGSSLSLLEALASGLAVIQTHAAGNGVTSDTGIMLERPDTDHLHAAMMSVIEDRDRLDHFRSHAQAEAQNYTFARYRDNIAKVLAEAGLGG